MFFPIFLSLQKCIATHPRFHITSAFRTLGNHRCWNTKVVINGSIHFINLFFVVINLVMATTITLKISPVTLNCTQLIFRYYTRKLSILIRSHDMVIFSFQKFHQVVIRLSRFAFIHQITSSGNKRPACLL